MKVKESGLVPPTTKPSSISRGSFFSFTTRWRPLRGRFRTLGRGRGRMSTYSLFLGLFIH
jgi:hypothetical protein